MQEVAGAVVALRERVIFQAGQREGNEIAQADLLADQKAEVVHREIPNRDGPQLVAPGDHL